MSKKALALLLALCLALSGCAFGAGAGEKAQVTVYRVEISENGSSLVRESAKVPAKTAEEIIKLLNDRPPDGDSLLSLPEGVNLKYSGLEKGVAKVEVSPEFFMLPPTEKLLMEGAVVLSLSTLDSVCYVDICGSEGENIGRFAVEDFLEADAVCGEYERTLKLYLPTSGLEYIEPRSVTVSDSGDTEKETLILQQLFLNIGNGMENTRILSVSVENGVCTVDLSEEFYGAEPAGSIGGMVIIYSIVNSLCRRSGVDAVHIRVEGQELSGYGGFSPMWPLGENMSLVRFGE